MLRYLLTLYGDPLFFSSPCSPHAALGRRRFLLSPSSCPSLPLSLSVRRITDGRGKTLKTGGGTGSQCLSPSRFMCILREEARRSSWPPRLSHGRHVRSRTSFRFFATLRMCLAFRRGMPIFFRFPFPFSSGYHAWELSKRAQRAVHVINNRGRINWNSFRYCAPNLS